LDDQISRTDFENNYVIRNWDTKAPYPVKEHEISPGGALAILPEGGITAGIFTGYNKESLSSGDHYLIETRSDSIITLHHPLGESTEITIRKLPNWTTDSSIFVTAITSGEKHQVNRTISGNEIRFSIHPMIAGDTVSHFEISSGQDTLASSIVTNEIQQIRFDIYPNPSHDEIKLVYEISQPGPVSIAIYDLYGRNVKQVVDDYHREGVYQCTIDHILLVPGTYLMIMESIQRRWVKKMVRY
jgi:hypothetical protein